MIPEEIEAKRLIDLHYCVNEVDFTSATIVSNKIEINSKSFVFAFQVRPKSTDFALIND
jgi:hypothetical protein